MKVRIDGGREGRRWLVQEGLKCERVIPACCCLSFKPFYSAFLTFRQFPLSFSLFSFLPCLLFSFLSFLFITFFLVIFSLFISLFLRTFLIFFLFPHSWIVFFLLSSFFLSSLPYRTSEDFDKPTRKAVEQSLVLSVINYCINMWCSGSKADLHNAQKLQNFAENIAVGGSRKYDHATLLRKELQWLNITDKYIFEKWITVYKVINGFYPEWLLKFPTVSESTTDMTRQENKLYGQRTRTDTGARLTTVCEPKFWNNLRQSIRKTSKL